MFSQSLLEVALIILFTPQPNTASATTSSILAASSPVNLRYVFDLKKRG